MRVALLGTSGWTGGQMLDWPLASGHDVIALARSGSRCQLWPGSRWTGDGTDASAVAETVAGAGAVLSALGPRGTESASLADAGRNLVTAMDKSGCKQLVCVSAAGDFICE
jgi:putative NADH-flavin reductase